MKKTVIIAINNRKGGVGKTSATLQLANNLIEKQFKVLVIDMDPQGSLSRSLLPEFNPYKKADDTIYDLLLTEKQLKDCVRKVKSNLDIVVSSEKHEDSHNEMLLSGALKPAATRLSEKIAPRKVATHDEELKEEYKSLQKEINKTYDYIIIDCAPHKDLLSTVSLAACDSVLIPVSYDLFAVDGIVAIVRHINEIKKQYNQSLRIDGIFLNAGKNIKSYDELHKTLLDKLPNYILKSKVNNYKAVNDDTFKKEVSESKAKEQFRAVFEEVGYGMERR